jgi:HEAT repeat protein
VFFLFDGLDEIPDAALRMKVVSHIEQFTQLHTASRFIVTSRIVGYKEAPLSASEYQVYTLADFSEEQVKIFTQRWCPAYERWVNGFSESQHLEDAATKEAEQLFDATQSKPAVKRLAVNPLLLTILALIQRQGIELPSHRIELYRLCTETLIDTWVKAKGQSIQFSKNELIRILRPLAFWMHEYAAVGAIPQEELHEQIVRQLVERTLNEYEANQQAEQFLQIVRGKTGILVERGKERYGFLHLTFEEYFTARAVELRKDREIFIKKHLHDPRWREVIFLTVGAVGIIQNDEEEVTQLVQAIVNAGSPYEWALHRDLFFAGHCLADDIGVLPAYEHEIIQRISLLYLTSPYNGLRTACSSILTAWSGTKIAEQAAQLVLPILQQWTATTEKKKMFVATSPFEKRVAEQLEQLTRQHHNEITKYLHFDITIILASLQMFEQVDWKKRLLDIFTSEEVKSQIVAIFEQDYSEQQSLIAALIAGLSDPHVNTRRKIINALGQLAPLQPEVSDALLSLLSDDSPAVRREAATILAQLSKTRPDLIESLLVSLENEGIRKYDVIDALGEIGNGQPAVIDTLLLALTDRDDESLRNAAARALAQISQGEPYITDALLIALPDYDAFTINTIVRSFGRIYGPHTSICAPVLSELTMLADPNVDALQVTAKALGKLSSNPSYTTDILLSSCLNAQKAKEIAVKILGYLGRGYPSSIDTLLSIVLDANTTLNIRRETMYALIQLGERQPRIVDTLLSILSSSLGRSMKSAAASALGELGDNQPHVIDMLLQVLSDASIDTRIRSAAASALGELGDNQPHVIDMLLQVLSTSSWPLKSTIATVLALKGQNEPHVMRTLLSVYKEQPRLINNLLMMSSSPHQQTKAAVIDFFEQQSKKQPEMTDVLLVALTDGSQPIPKNARNLLIHLSEIHPYGTHDLIVALSRTDLTQEATEGYKNRAFGMVTARAIDMLREINSDYLNSVNTLFTALQEEDYGIKSTSARMLVHLSKRRTDLLERFLDTLPYLDDQTRMLVAEAFSRSEQLGPSAVIDILLLLLSDESPRVRRAAIRALERVGKRQARIIESLISALSDVDWFVRLEAARILGRPGREQPQVIDALLQALSDSSGSVRQSAALEAVMNFIIEKRQAADASACNTSKRGFSFSS